MVSVCVDVLMATLILKHFYNYHPLLSQSKSHRRWNGRGLNVLVMPRQNEQVRFFFLRTISSSEIPAEESQRLLVLIENLHTAILISFLFLKSCLFGERSFFLPSHDAHGFHVLCFWRLQ